jgi:predicted peptidase
MKINLQISTSGRFSASPKKRFLIALVGMIVVALLQFPSASNGMDFNEQALRALAALEKKVNTKVSKKDFKRLSKEEQAALAKTQEEANIAWAKYREKYLEWQTKKNAERAKQGKELYQEFLIPRGTATYLAFDVKIEDLHAGVHDGGYRGPMHYRYFVPELDEGEKAPLILFLHGTDWQRVEFPRNGTNNYYQFREPEILAFVQPVAQKKYPCFLVAPQQINGTPWCSPPRSSPSRVMENAVDIVDVLIARYPNIDTNRLYVTGVDSGSAGAFEAVAQYPNKFAALVAMSGGRDPDAFGEKQKTTAWVSYCEGESPGVTEYSDVMFKLFSSWGGDSRLVVYPGEGRMSWEYGYMDKNLYAWLFKQSL